MPTLNIEGQKVKVDDGFLNLSPEQQTATVEEIAASLGIKSGRVKGSAPEGQEPDIYKRRAEAEANVLQERRQQGGLGDFLESAVTNLPFGRSIAAIPGGAYRMLSDGVNPIEGWRREKALIQEQAEQRSERSPVADMAGAVTGGVAGAIPVVRGAQALGLGLKAGAGLGARMTAGAAGGAGMGAVYGFDQADAGERVQGATSGMLTGAALGGAIPAVGAGIRKVGGSVARRLSNAPKPQIIPSSQLADEASALYRQAEQSGVTIKPSAMSRALANMEISAGRINEKLRPKTAGIVEEIQSLKNKPITLEELDELRQVVGRAMKAADPDDVRTLQRMKTTLDAFADNQITPKDITGDISGFDFIKKAREVYSRKAKASTLEEMIERAQNQATGLENGLVIEFRKLANNAKKMKAFSPEEQQLIKDVVRRSGGHSVLRAIGMLSPNSTFGGLTTGGALVGGGVLPGAALGGVGYGARRGAEALTRAQANRAMSAITSGNMPSIPPLPPQLVPLQTMADQFGRIAPMAGAAIGVGATSQ